MAFSIVYNAYVLRITRITWRVDYTPYVYAYISVAMRYPRLKIKFLFWQRFFYSIFSLSFISNLFHTLIEIIRMNDLKWSGTFVRGETSAGQKIKYQYMSIFGDTKRKLRTKFQTNYCEYFAKPTFQWFRDTWVIEGIWKWLGIGEVLHHLHILA